MVTQCLVTSRRQNSQESKCQFVLIWQCRKIYRVSICRPKTNIDSRVLAPQFSICSKLQIKIPNTVNFWLICFLHGSFLFAYHYQMFAFSVPQCEGTLPSVLWRCWLGGRKGIRPVKNIGGWWRWALVSLDGVTPSRMIGVSASVNLPLHHKVQKFSSGTGLPRWSWKKGHKMVVVWCYHYQMWYSIFCWTKS